MENKLTVTDAVLASYVLPIIQSYQPDPKPRLWTIDESTRFVIPNKDKYINNARLKEVVELISTEFSKKGIPSASKMNQAFAEESDISSQDIVVTLDDNAAITNESTSNEAYKIEVGAEGVKIVAASENAAMYALRTIQHILITNKNSLVYGTIIDYPDLSERRLHIDMGRKYFSKKWLIQHIRELSYLKMNTIQLHFAENLGFRIECDFDPAIVSQDGYLKKAEVREVIAEAKKYGVKIIPSLDSPGHVEHILKTHPEYGQVDKYGQKSKVALDVTNPQAVNYIKELYSEYMELFEESTDFHIGADEYMEFDRPPFTTDYKEVLDKHAHETFGEGFTWKDVIANYINDIAAHVYEGGFKPRIFNDGIYYGENDPNEPEQQITMHDYIGIDFWSQMGWNPSIAELKVFVEKGHQNIYNLNANYFYYVLRNDLPEDGRKQHSFDFLNQDKRIYNEWTPGIFDRNTVDDHSDFIKGAQLSVWCDNPNIVSEDGITKDIAKELRAFATKTWNMKSNKTIDFHTFVENYQRIGNVNV